MSVLCLKNELHNFEKPVFGTPKHFAYGAINSQPFSPYATPLNTTLVQKI